LVLTGHVYNGTLIGPNLVKQKVTQYRNSELTSKEFCVSAIYVSVSDQISIVLATKWYRISNDLFIES
jgi:hypothetical protein